MSENNLTPLLVDAVVNIDDRKARKSEPVRLGEILPEVMRDIENRMRQKRAENFRE